MESSAARQLFAGRPLRNALDRGLQAAHKTLYDWNPEALLSASEDSIVDQLLRKATLDLPTLLRDQAYLEDPTDVPVTRFTLVVPYAGPMMYFDMTLTPAGFLRNWITPVQTRSVYAEIHTRFLRLYSGGSDATQVKANFDWQLDQIEQRLDLIRAQVEMHNQRMADEIPAAVAQRRARLLADRNVQSTIGYPTKYRPDAVSYSVPIKRRRITPVRAIATAAELSNPYAPEPALADADYEAALAVLRNVRNALERSPATSSKLSEPEVRDLLLVTLNGQFEGRAAGEVFNGAGKTDILIREGDRNVFIGECKIWKGPKTIQDALTQLLSYLVWRDTKAALLLFIRDADISTVVDKALLAITNHPSYKRPGKISSEERHDFIIHANGDASREIHLAFLPFLIGSRKA